MPGKSPSALTGFFTPCPFFEDGMKERHMKCPDVSAMMAPSLQMTAVTIRAGAGEEWLPARSCDFWAVFRRAVQEILRSSGQIHNKSVASRFLFQCCQPLLKGFFHFRAFTERLFGSGPGCAGTDRISLLLRSAHNFSPYDTH